MDKTLPNDLVCYLLMTKYFHWFIGYQKGPLPGKWRLTGNKLGGRAPDFWQMVKFKRQMKRKQDMNHISIYLNPVFSYQAG